VLNDLTLVNLPFWLFIHFRLHYIALRVWLGSAPDPRSSGIPQMIVATAWQAASWQLGATWFRRDDEDHWLDV